MTSLTEMIPSKLKELPKDELSLAWLRLNQWYGAAKHEGRAIENYVNAAGWVMNEMDKRGMDYDKKNELVVEARKLTKAHDIEFLKSKFPSLPEDLVVIQNFVAVVGSTAKGKTDPGDMDILFRAAKKDGHYLIQSENMWLPIRNVLDPEKEGYLSFIPNPQGPHGNNVPLYDLVLRRCKEPRVNVVKSAGVYASFRVEKACADRLHKYLVDKGLKNVVPPEKMHVTTVYSRKDFKGYEPSKAKIVVPPKSFVLDRLGEHNALVMYFDSPHVVSQHKKAMELGASWDHDGYRPHLTLSYDTGDSSLTAPPDFALVLDGETIDELNIEWATDEGLRKDSPGIADVHVPSVFTVEPGKKKKVRKAADLLEELAELEHQQWMNWAKTLVKEESLSEERVAKWKKMFVAYRDLPDIVKEADRIYARKVLSLISGSVEKIKKRAPLFIDLGCGNSKPAGYIGYDVSEHADADQLCDLEKGIPCGDGTVDIVRANHFLEHCADQNFIMREIYRVLCPGGSFLFEVPSTQGEGAFAHPDHKSFWNKSSFVFWTSPEYVDDRPRFDIKSLEEYGQGDRIYVKGELVKPAIEDDGYEYEYNTTSICVIEVEPSEPVMYEPPSDMRYDCTFCEEKAVSLYMWAGGKKYIPACSSHIADAVNRIVNVNKDVVSMVIHLSPTTVTVSVTKAFAPFRKFTPPKPKMAGMTEIFSVEELWKWAESKLPVSVSPKWNGFRVIVERKGDKLRMWTEGTPDRDILPRLPMLDEPLRKIPGDWILDADLGIERNGKRLSRPELMRFNRENITFARSEHPVLTFFDVPYYNEDLSQLTHKEREDALSKIKFEGPYLHKSPLRWVDNKEELTAATHWGFGFYRSEGVVAKEEASKYEQGALTTWSKLKRVVELKVVVLDVKSTSGNTYNYRGGLLQSKGDEWVNEKDGIVDLGWSFNTSIQANAGDIITVHVLELVPDPVSKTLTWLGANVLDVDDSRKTPYTTEQAMDVARRGKVLQSLDGELIKKGDEEGDVTRGESAEKFWTDNWDTLYPKSGKGRFVYQHHWRGLIKNDEVDETKLGDSALLNTEHSVHGDLRFEADDALWGFSVFIGTTDANRNGDKLITVKPDEKIQGTFKLAQPKPWLSVGVGKPHLSEPGGVGATSQTFAKFFALDNGTYEMGVRHRHFAEVFIKGKHLDGRYLIQSIPGARGKRSWVISKPADQTPMAESQDLDSVVAKLKARGHKSLLWAKPGMEPELIDVVEYKPVEVAKAVSILKADEEKQCITGVVLEPNTVDAHGDIVSPDEIEQAAYNFMIKSRVIGLQHSRRANGVRVVESYICPMDTIIGAGHVKKGSWIMTVKVEDRTLWKRVKDGEYTGFSIGGMAVKK